MENGGEMCIYPKSYFRVYESKQTRNLLGILVRKSRILAQIQETFGTSLIKIYSLERESIMSGTFTTQEINLARKLWEDANPDTAFPKSNITIILFMRSMGWK